MTSTDITAILHGLHADWVMGVLLALGCVGLALIGERALSFCGIHVNLSSLAAALDAQLRAGRYAEALTALSASRGIEAAVAAAGLSHADLGPIAAERAIAGAVALQRMRMERGLAFLGTLGNNAPFVGLLGTVLSVIEAFDALGQGSLAGAAQQNMMAGIAEALTATAVGLLVAIPTVAFYNYFHRRIAGTLASTEALTNVLLAHLYAEEAGEPHGEQP